MSITNLFTEPELRTRQSTTDAGLGSRDELPGQATGEFDDEYDEDKDDDEPPAQLHDGRLL